MSIFGRIDSGTSSALIAGFSLIAAGTDLYFGRIFNWFNVTMLVTGLVFSFLRGGFPGLGDAALGVVAGLFLYGWMFALRVMGGGDVKFLMALGAWGGLAYTVEVAILGVLLGGAMAFAILVFKGRIWAFAGRMYRFFLTVFVKELTVEAPRIDRSMTMPFGVPIAIAAVWSIYLHPLKGFFLELGVRL